MKLRKKSVSISLCGCVLNVMFTFTSLDPSWTRGVILVVKWFLYHEVVSPSLLQSNQSYQQQLFKLSIKLTVLIRA